MSAIGWYHPDDSFRLERSTDGAYGYDLRWLSEGRSDFELAPGQRHIFATGLRLALPMGVEAQVRSRSGLVLHHGVGVVWFGPVDADYRGDVSPVLFNHGQQPYTVVRGERIAQLVFAPVLVPAPDSDGQVLHRPFASAYDHLYLRRVKTVEDLGVTKRGEGGYGSTGR